MKKLLISLLLCGAACANAAPVSLDTAAKGAAVADGVTTYIGLAGSNAQEANALINTSPIGLATMTALKVGVVVLIDKADIPQKDKQSLKRTATALWGGAAVNNLLAIASAAPPVSILGGVVAGVYLWKQRYADDMNAEPTPPAPPAPAQAVEPLVADPVPAAS